MMASFIYTLCALTAGLCAWLLLRAYHDTRYRLLFWSSLFFIIIAVNNLFLMVDRLVFPMDLSVIRYAISLVAHGLLLFGLISESK
ncbi:DUF5985 family protein [Nitrospira sp. BLG_2]|uniref:DUF5985 family protein n=1 Tax=Nitrospira sp. BLG_2 TaxID=3397507 RepID=UPI003B9D5CC0